MKYDCIVVGSGCAGLTTALNLARSGRKTLVLESDTFGGQIAFAPKVENFPTIQEISGADFSEKLCDQVLAHGAEIDLGKVQKVIKRGEKDFVVVSDYGQYECRSVVLATGAKHRHLGFEKERRFEGKGVGFCAVCDGAFTQAKVFAFWVMATLLCNTHCIWQTFAPKLPLLRCLIDFLATINWLKEFWTPTTLIG